MWKNNPDFDDRMFQLQGGEFHINTALAFDKHLDDLNRQVSMCKSISQKYRWRDFSLWYGKGVYKAP